MQYQWTGSVLRRCYMALRPDRYRGEHGGKRKLRKTFYQKGSRL